MLDHEGRDLVTPELCGKTLDIGPILRMDAIDDPHALEFFGLETGQAAIGGVRLDDLSSGLRHDETDRGLRESVSEFLLALAQRPFGLLLPSDILGRNDDAANRARPVRPGIGGPAQPMSPAVGVDPHVVVVAVELARFDQPMDRLPTVGNVGMERVVVDADQGVEASPIIDEPAPARRHIIHPAVKHRDFDRRLFDEPSDLRLAVPHRQFGGPEIGQVVGDDDHPLGATRLEIDLPALGDPAQRAVVLPQDAVFGLIDAVAGRIAGGGQRRRGSLAGPGKAQGR